MNLPEPQSLAIDSNKQKKVYKLMKIYVRVEYYPWVSGLQTQFVSTEARTQDKSFDSKRQVPGNFSKYRLPSRGR